MDLEGGLVWLALQYSALQSYGLLALVGHG
jgi:hypothetical protein